MAIKKVVVGTTPVKISEGMNPKTLIVQNLSASTIYVISDPHNPITEGIEVEAGATYTNIYAKGSYYLLSASSSLDVRVEET